MKPKLMLGDTKLKLRSLGVADVIVDSITQTELDAINADTSTPAYCHKCDSEHTVGSAWALKVGLKRDFEGRIMTKCGRCYL